MTTHEADTPVSPEVREAYAYLGAVTERSTAQVWDLVDAVGPHEAAARIRSGRVDDEVAGQTAARHHRVDPRELAERAAEVGARLLVPGDPGWPAVALEPLDRPRRLRSGGTGGVETALRPFGLWWRGPAHPADVLERSVACLLYTSDAADE